ncbi:MAG: porin family protein [Candidatus Kapabacteria bacterium]|nr:porin family protein [Candidatus Kapabacteria bacterium]
MKKIFFLFLMLFCTQLAYSQLGIGFHTGLSTPNNQINNVYNTDKLDLKKADYFGNLVREATKIGYHIGMKLRLNMSDNLFFVGGIVWNKFPQTTIEILNSKSGDTLIILQATQNVIPISAGLNLYLFQGLISPYLTGDLAYTIISNSIDFKQIPLTGVEIDPRVTDARAGFGLGAGFDIDLKLVYLNIEGKYNISNLIGKDSEEKNKNYFTLTLGVYFGNPVRKE